MKMDKEVGCQPLWRLSFCLFCQYLGSNDQSYLNHIMCTHYCANYGCGKCLDTVVLSGQKLSKHMKKCKGLAVDGVKEKPFPSCVKGAPLLSSKKKKHKKSHSNSHKKLQGDSQLKSQSSSQANSQQDSQMSLHARPNWSMHKAKQESATATPQKKSHSGGIRKHLSEKHLSSKTSSGKEKECKMKHISNKNK